MTVRSLDQSKPSASTTLARIVDRMAALDRAKLTISEKAKVSTVRVGVEPHQTATIVDDAYRDPNYVRELALSLEFTRSRGKFPGYDARLSLSSWAGNVADFVNRNTDSRIEPYGESKHDVVFSMTDERVDSTRRRMRHPHIDSGLSPRTLYAGLIYLNPKSQCRGGTAFYRHRESGASELTAAVSPKLRSYQAAHGIPSLIRAYRKILELDGFPEPTEALADGEWDTLTESDERWEKTGEIEMVPNRLVLYNARLFHSAKFSNGYFGTTKDSRRLTQTGCFVAKEDSSRGVDPHGLIEAGLVG